MSRRVGNLVILEEEEEDICELCGIVAETRPYGPGGKRVCFKCGMKDPEGAARRCARVLFGAGEEPVS